MCFRLLITSDQKVERTGGEIFPIPTRTDLECMWAVVHEYMSTCESKLWKLGVSSTATMRLQYYLIIFFLKYPIIRFKTC